MREASGRHVRPVGAAESAAPVASPTHPDAPVPESAIESPADSASLASAAVAPATLPDAAAGPAAVPAPLLDPLADHELMALPAPTAPTAAPMAPLAGDVPRPSIRPAGHRRATGGGARAATARLGYAVPAVAVVGAALLAAMLGVLPVGATPQDLADAPAAQSSSAQTSAPTPAPGRTDTKAASAAALPTVPKDPAAAAKLIDALRPQIAAASAAYDRSQVAVTAAAQAVITAQQRAIVAERQAGDARDRVAGWAAYLYRTTGGAGLMTQMLDSINDDPSVYLRSSGDAAILGDGLVYDLRQAQTRLADSREASGEAARLQAAAQTQAAASETARTGLLALLSKAQLLVASSQGAASAQTLITAAACPTSSPANTLRDGSAALTVFKLCRDSVAQAATPQAALAIMAAFHMLGAPYACGGVGRQDPFRFDCSSLVSRAYFLGAGLNTAGADWAPSTRDMVPWDGVPLASWASYVAPKFARPGDLVLYDTGGAAYRHVVMLLAHGFMLHTNSCGDVAHVSAFAGFGISPGHAFLVARRVLAPGGVRVPDPVTVPTHVTVPGKPGKPAPGAGDPKVTPPPTLPVAAPTPAPAPSTSTPVPTTSTPTTPAPVVTTTTPPATPTTPGSTTTAPTPGGSSSGGSGTPSGGSSSSSSAGTSGPPVTAGP